MSLFFAGVSASSFVFCVHLGFWWAAELNALFCTVHLLTWLKARVGA